METIDGATQLFVVSEAKCRGRVDRAFVSVTVVRLKGRSIHSGRKVHAYAHDM